jgi:ParB family chromosome partitioning protein
LAAARTNPSAVLRDAAAIYKVDANAIGLKVKQDFAEKEKAKKAPKAATSVGKTKQVA